eukprot:4297993-Pyramimonas_sp.AAC.1
MEKARWPNVVVPSCHQIPPRLVAGLAEDTRKSTPANHRTLKEFNALNYMARRGSKGAQVGPGWHQDVPGGVQDGTRSAHEGSPNNDFVDGSRG